ncbi:MAG: hypothetical protein KC877_03300, partial [Candidatus Kaiserbacteria bacterium]|nr:hypothetical protein [Candidatus Kaiserbacteria bacterium]
NIPEKVANIKVDNMILTQFATPLVVVALIVGIYKFHLPGMHAAADVIDGFQAADPVKRLDAFERAVDRNSFAHQEITEQLAQQTISVARNPQIPEEVRAQYAAYTEEQLMRLETEKPGDARIEVFIGSYYRATNQLDKAAEHMALARQYSPLKQAIIQQQGFVALTQAKNDEAVSYFKEAYELDERNLQAREFYAAALFQVGATSTAAALMQSDNDEVDQNRLMMQFAKSDFLISSANQAGQYDFVAKLFEYRLATDPATGLKWVEDPQNWATLAFLYYQQDMGEKAIETLNTAAERLPEFAPTAQCFAENIAGGRDPQEGCQ